MTDMTELQIKINKPVVTHCLTLACNSKGAAPDFKFILGYSSR